MAYAVTAWAETEVKMGGEWHKIYTCTSTATTSDKMHYTDPTPASLDTTKPFTLIANAAGATLDDTDAEAPLDIYGGWSTAFALSGPTGTSPTVTSGVLAINNAIPEADYDLRTVAGKYSWNPGVTAGHSPYKALAFQIQFASVVVAASCSWVIIQ